MKTATYPFALIALVILGSSPSIPGAELEDAGSMHAHHHMMMEQTKHQIADYKLPQIQLVREDGKNVSLIEELNDGRPLVLNFMYTTCTEICPLTSKTFAELQNKLGNDRDRVHMVSISIDPEQDTPEVLAKYAHKFGAGTQWQFYTGTTEASIAAQRSFEVYRGDKMEHNPVTFIRAAPGKPWLRIDGFAKSDELLSSLRDMDVFKDEQHPGIAY
ncbi:SCO family protein [Sideroxydans sp. CL21]|uniref:SCO family protein n=1 Tax=Sideroxydans sp. CL21 TaxID=2600596 RepID=UPI0012A82C8A|nr:SCO family protein [Sideroxydans sp. CL21]VVC83622.1 Cytochrome oxidase biogenesis protein Sco1/SenC/PrrC, thiol-disulfide reductase involved in Cu(I) insertion into CoxII Cu(A) center [Sideroxydans sp. CL21]